MRRWLQKRESRRYLSQVFGLRTIGKPEHKNRRFLPEGLRRFALHMCWRLIGLAPRTSDFGYRRFGFFVQIIVKCNKYK